MTFHWNDEKNAWLKETRGITFERIVVAIEEGGVLDILEHPNKTRYPGQLVIIVEIDGYACCVPCVEEQTGDYFLKTLFKSRKCTKQYLLGELQNE